MSHDDKIKEYFQDEMNKVKIPLFPGERQPVQTNWKDILATAACIALVVAVMLNPASQNSQIRSINLSAHRFDEITNRISQVFIDASPYLY